MSHGGEGNEGDDTMCDKCPARDEPLDVPCPYFLDGLDCPTPDMAAPTEVSRTFEVRR